MVWPVSGPFNKSWTLKGQPTNFGFKPVWTSGTRTWYRQVVPYRDPLPFTYNLRTVTSFFGGDGADYVSTDSVPVFSFTENQKARLYNAVYERFIGKVKKDAAELASTLATWTQARDMITDRATRLMKGVSAVRRKDTKALKALWGKGAGIRANSKKVGSNVLEVSFGWGPLVGDIAAACAVLAAGIPPPYVKARQKLAYTATTGWVDMGALDVKKNVDGYIEWSLRAWVRVTNPNTLLYNELGLANPIGVLWEVTPWSFVIDYFVNVNAFLASFTDLLGLELERPNKTFFAIEHGFHSGRYDLPKPYSAPTWRWDRVHVDRTTGIPGPTLALRLPWQLSMFRASTSIALLLQQLRK